MTITVKTLFHTLCIRSTQRNFVVISGHNKDETVKIVEV